MKKIVLLLVIVLALVLACAYLLLPARIKVNVTEGLSCTQRELQLSLHDSSKWVHWVPDSAANYQNIQSGRGFAINGAVFHMVRKLSNGADFEIAHGGKTYRASLGSVNIRPDSLLASIETVVYTDGGLLQRIHLLFEAPSIRSSMKEVLEHLQHFTADNKNIYGYSIVRTGFDDSLLIAVKQTSNRYPEVAQVYAMVHQLEDHLKAAGAKATDHPMFHVMEEDSSHFTTMVAIAVDKMIPESKPFFMIRMVHINGKYIKAEVTGGPGTLKDVHRQIENFMTDHMLTAPAIPFEIMVTDRSQQPDTSKWVTVVYHPST